MILCLTVGDKNRNDNHPRFVFVLCGFNYAGTVFDVNSFHPEDGVQPLLSDYVNSYNKRLVTIIDKSIVF